MSGMGRLHAYSQNSIRSPLIVKRLLSKSKISGSDIIIEIGAGSGIITQELAQLCKRVLAYEIDPYLYKGLYNKLGSNKKIGLVNADFLKSTLPSYPYKVVANIPFNFTSRIINKLLKSPNPPTHTYLILQEEAALKFMGYPKETQMSLLLKPKFKFGILDKLNRSDFQPNPRVNSVFIEIEKLSDPYLKETEYYKYQDFIVYTTTQWKPSVAESLKKIFTKEQIKRLSNNIGFDPNMTPLSIVFEKWLELYKYFDTSVDPTKQQCVKGSYNKQLNIQKGLKKFYRTRKIDPDCFK